MVEPASSELRNAGDARSNKMVLMIETTVIAKATRAPSSRPKPIMRRGSTSMPEVGNTVETAKP